MKKEEMFEVVKDLHFDVRKSVYEENGVVIEISRPSVLSKRFKGYDNKRNFQIWLKRKDREFRPNHLRIFIDLNLRIRSRPDLKKDLMLAFDNIFYGNDPLKELDKLSEEKFDHFLNSLKIIGVLSQLFLIEQEYNYNKESNFIV